MDMGMNMGMGAMSSMIWNWQTSNITVVFSFWHIESLWNLWISCLVLCALAVGQEHLHWRRIAYNEPGPSALTGRRRRRTTWDASPSLVHQSLPIPNSVTDETGFLEMYLDFFSPHDVTS
jgi:hypothetical protein